VLATVQLLVGLGFVVGLLTCLGRHRPAAWQLPVLALGVLLVLRASWLFDADWRDFWKTMPVHAATVVGLPLGMLAANALVAGARYLFDRRQSP
jgi:hypothetical protein